MPNTTARAVSHRKRIALIDADGILYAAALKGETVCDGEQLQMVPVEKVYQDALRRVEEQIEWVDAEDAFLCLSDRRNFRVDILPAGHPGSIGGTGYKGNRKGSRPLVLDALRAMFVEQSRYKVLLIAGLEADDVCGISSGHLRAGGSEPIIISPDKDLLQIPGLVCTPLPNGKHPITEVTPAAGDRWHIYQTLCGDTCDNYKGCPGVGPKRAGLLLDYCELEGFSLGRTWGEAIDQFYAADLTTEDALVQARVSRILRASDWDAKRKEPILFEFPKDRMKGVLASWRGEEANDTEGDWEDAA